MLNGRHVVIAGPNGATLKTKVEAFLGEMWDGAVSETLDIDDAWKSYEKVQALVGNITR